MGETNFGNFKSYLQVTLGNRSGLDTYLPIWINNAYVELCSRNRFYNLRLPEDFTFPELDTTTDETTIDGVAYVDRPSTCLRVNTVWDMTNDKHLTYRSWNWYVDQTGRQDADSEDEPSYWIPYGNKIYLSPTPDDAYNLRVYYRRRPARLENTGDVTAIGEEWDEPILQLAAVKAHMWLRDFEKVKIWQDVLEETIRGLVGLQEKEAKDMDRRLQPHPAYHKSGGYK